MADWQSITPLDNEDPARPPRRVLDPTALVAGCVFIVFAVLGMTGLDLDWGFFADGGVLWLVLIGAGVTLLVRELRRARRHGTTL